MNRRYLNGMLAVLSIALCSAPASGHMRVDAPNGGEVLTAGGIFTIEYTNWIAHPPIDHFELYYSTESSTTGFQPIDLNIIPPDPNVGPTLFQYDWTVPSISAPEVWVKVIMIAGVFPASYPDVSDQPFSIGLGPIPQGDTIIELETVATGLTAPIYATHAGDASGRLFIVEQSGQIRIVKNDALLPTPFLDIASKLPTLNPGFDERGLLGLAFHPSYAINGRFFVRYSAPRTGDPCEPCFGSSRGCHTSVLAEYAVSAGDPDLADPCSEIILFTIDQPQFNHDGGHVAFGPDGFLYFSLGDGGGAHDGLADVPPSHGPLGNGQNIETALGSILRIDVDSPPQVPLAYAVPPGNPFVGITGVDEIYAYGMRNPYRFSFDDGLGGTDRLFLADVGQNVYEEIDLVENGGNYGWVIREGFHCFDPFNPTTPPASCFTTGPLGEPLLDPIAEYSHAQGGLTVIGGFVYRGSQSPALDGKYIFGDFSAQFSVPSGRLYFLDETAPGSFTMFEFQIGPTDDPYGLFLKGFGQDEDGEIYACGSTALAPFGATGIVERIVVLASDGVAQIPAAKDNTLFEDVAGGLSSGAGQHLYSGQTGGFDGNKNKRGLLSFDIAGHLPPGSTITSASLQLRMTQSPNGIARTTQLRRVLQDWGEGTSVSGGGAGAAATTGDATWLHTFFNTSFWTTPGGDLSPTVSAGNSVTGVATYSWGSTAQMVADAQSWLDSPAGNFGWLLLGDESTGKTVKQFGSRENATPANRPVLTVEFDPPPIIPACWDFLTQCHGDTDGDGDVDTVDWPTFRDSFGATYPEADYHPCGDMDHDGDVDTVDWPEFRDNFGDTPTADCTPGGVWPPIP